MKNYEIEKYQIGVNKTLLSDNLSEEWSTVYHQRNDSHCIETSEVDYSIAEQPYRGRLLTSRMSTVIWKKGSVYDYSKEKGLWSL